MSASAPRSARSPRSARAPLALRLLASLGPGAGAAISTLAAGALLTVTALVLGASPAGVGATVTVGCAALAAAWTALWSARSRRALRHLHREALARLQHPDVLRTTGPRVPRQLADLARVLEALQLRVRVADEVADRQRRMAETASSGVGELLSGLVAAEEGARGQLAAELHDTVAQSLLAARQVLADTGDASGGQAGELLDEAEEQVRAVMARTRPPELRRGDLAVAVGALCDDLLRRYGLRVALRWTDQPVPLPVTVAVVVYRFFQEALLNVVKHAEGDHATACLAIDEQGLRAEVVDGGPGFDADRFSPGAGGRQVGLVLLTERARLAGGSLVVSSSPGSTTTVELRLPARALRPRATGPRLDPAPLSAVAAGGPPG